MRTAATPLLVVATLVLGGCGTPFLKQGANQFNSNTYVGWVPPDQDLVSALSGSTERKIWTYNVRGPAGDAHAVRLDDCFAVDYAGGYFHDSFEGAIEKGWARLMGTPVRSEVSIVLKAEQRVPESKRTAATRDLKEEGTFVFSNTGQIRSRHFTGNSYDSFFGQTRYRGGELQLTASVSEQDEAEYNEMVEDSVKFAKSAKNAADKQTGKKPKFDSWIGELFDQASTNDVAKLTISPLGYVAVAAEAVKAGAYMLQTVNQDDDNVMHESITLINANSLGSGDTRKAPIGPLLRYGSYIFARASTASGEISHDACIGYSPDTRTVRARFQHCPQDGEGKNLLQKWPDGWHTVTAIVINIRPVADPLCKPLTAPSVPITPTGVIQGK